MQTSYINSEGKSYHRFGLGVEGSDKIGLVLLLEPNTRTERMSRIVLENTTRGVIDQHQTLFPAHVGKRQRANNVGADCLHLMGLAPVDVGPTRHTGGVENVRRTDGGDVGLEGGPVLQPTRPVNIFDTLSFAELTQQPANPACAPVYQKLIGLS